MDIYSWAENGLSSLSPSGVSVCIIFHRHSSLAVLKAPPSEEMSRRIKCNVSLLKVGGRYGFISYRISEHVGTDDVGFFFWWVICSTDKHLLESEREDLEIAEIYAF